MITCTIMDSEGRNEEQLTTRKRVVSVGSWSSITMDWRVEGVQGWERDLEGENIIWIT